MPSAHDERQTLVIVGNGMTSYRLCLKLVESGANESIRIVVFGEERFPAYDRVHLTDLFGGRDGESLIFAEEDWYEKNGIELHLDDPILRVDREHSVVESCSGHRVPYNRLVFATGSAPFVPPIEGIFTTLEDGSKVPRKGVFVYRTFDDVYSIEADVEGSLRVAVIGGGLLGLEAAKAIFDLGQRLHPIDVQVVEVAPGLMPRQLDAQAAEVLKQKIEELGVKVQVGKKITRISSTADTRDPDDEGEDFEERLIVHFEEGSILPVDMIIVSTGIRPRGELAREAGLSCAPNGGIIVDDRLQTSDDQIFAIGECAAHNGVTYGLVAPGYQMVDVLVANLLGEQAEFKGADQSAKLKLLGVTVAALGEYDGDTKPLSSALRYTTGGVYRKLVTRQGKLIGAVTVGDWENLDRIREALLSPVPMSFWDMRRFRSTGNLFTREESLKVTEWADDAMVCGCMRVTRGALTTAINQGCVTVAALSSKTGAGTVCGSCKPLLAELLNVDEQRETQIPVAAVPSPLISMRGDGPPSRKDRPPASRRTMPPAAISSGRRPSVPGMPAIRAAGLMNIMVPGSLPPSSGQPRARRRTLPMVEIGGALADTLPEVTGLPLIVDRADVEVPSSKRPSSRPPPARNAARPSSRPPAPGGMAESLEAVLRSLPPPLPPEDEAEVGLSSDRAPALLNEPAHIIEPLQITPLPPLPAFFDEPAIHDDDDFEDEYEEEAEAAFSALDGPTYDFGLVQSRRSWVPPKRMSMLPPERIAPVGASASPQRKEVAAPEAGLRPLLVSSIAAVLLSVVAAASRPMPVPTSLAGRLGPSRIFMDDVPRQVTGYVLLGLCVLSLVLSLRKRWKRFSFLDVPTFKAIHGIIGAMTVLGLVVHTGMRLGHRMNFVLAVDFLAVCVLGAAAGIVTGISSRWSPLTARNRRLLSSRVHLAAFWPLPVLVALHVFQVYYY